MIREKVVRSAMEAIKATAYHRRPSKESIDSIAAKDGVIYLRRTASVLQNIIGTSLRRHVEVLD